MKWSELSEMGQERALHAAERWESEFARKRAEDFNWYVEEAPPELVEAVNSAADARALALDVGCGPGSLTRFLAGHFKQAIGFDISPTAVRGAGSHEEARRADFLTAAAPFLPFRTDAFAFILDRGCIQWLSPDAQAAYFEEVVRLLREDGCFVLYIPERPRAMREPPPQLRPLVQDVISFSFKSGKDKPMTYGVYRKVSQPAATA